MKQEREIWKKNKEEKKIQKSERKKWCGRKRMSEDRERKMVRKNAQGGKKKDFLRLVRDYFK